MEPPASASNPVFAGLLPEELALNCLSFLDARSLCRAQRVSKSWQRLATDDQLWKGVSEQRFGNIATRLHGTRPWKETYKTCERRDLVYAGVPQNKQINSLESIGSFCDDEISVTVDRKGIAHVFETKTLKELQTVDLKLDEEILNNPKSSYITRHGNQVGFVFRTDSFKSITVWDRSKGKICLSKCEDSNASDWRGKNLHLYGDYAATFYWNRVEIYNITTHRPSEPLNNEADVYISCDQFVITTHAENGEVQIRVFDLTKLQYVATLFSTNPLQNTLGCTYLSAYKHEDTLILSRKEGRECFIEVWDINTWQRIRSYEIKETALFVPVVCFANEKLIIYKNSSLQSFCILNRINGHFLYADNGVDANGQRQFSKYFSVMGSICYINVHHGLIFVGTNYATVYFYDPLTHEKVRDIHHQNALMHAMHVKDTKVIMHTDKGTFEYAFTIPPKTIPSTPIVQAFQEGAADLVNRIRGLWR